jgi:hypothetical protein
MWKTLADSLDVSALAIELVAVRAKLLRAGGREPAAASRLFERSLAPAAHPEDLTGKRALKCADGASGVLRGPALRVTWRNG